MEDTMQSQLVCVSVFAACVCQDRGVHVTTHRIFFLIFIFGCMGSQHPCIMQAFPLQCMDSLWCTGLVASGHTGS